MTFMEWMLLWLAIIGWFGCLTFGWLCNKALKGWEEALKLNKDIMKLRK